MRGVETAPELERRRRKWVALQRYHPESRIFVIEINGRPNVTNQRNLVERELELESGQAEARDEGEGVTRLLDAPNGLTNVSSEEGGSLRVLSRPIVRGGRSLGTFRVC